jgi:hypothetical protein
MVSLVLAIALQGEEGARLWNISGSMSVFLCDAWVVSPETVRDGLCHKNSPSSAKERGLRQAQEACWHPAHRYRLTSPSPHWGIGPLILRSDAHQDDHQMMGGWLACDRVQLQAFCSLTRAWITHRLEQFKSHVDPGKQMRLPLNLDELNVDQGGLGVDHLLDQLAGADRVIEDIIDDADIVTRKAGQSSWGQQKR